MTTQLPTTPTINPTDYAHLTYTLLTHHITPDTEKLPIIETSGRVLAETLTAPRPLPHFANSQMDGYALTDTAATRPDRTFYVGKDIPAGSTPSDLPIQDDIAYPIMTGAPLPTGYTTVIPVEDTQPLSGIPDPAGFVTRSNTIHIPPANPGQYVRQPGEDIAAGATLATAGTRITPTLIGALAASGITAVYVYNRPRVVLITGGDEITHDASATPTPGKILDANGPLLSTIATDDGGHTQRIAIGDSPSALIRILTRLVTTWKPDLIITSGGISQGKYEVVRLALTQLAQEPGKITLVDSWLGTVTQQPGGPQGLALLRASDSEGPTIPLLALPGNPVSTLISYILLARPALRAITGNPLPGPLYGQLTLDAPISTPSTKTQYRRAQIHQEHLPTGNTRTLLTPDPLTGSHLLHRAAQAQALVQLDPNTTYTGGETVRYLPL